MLGRTKERINEKHIGSELSQGLGHFRSAASMAAGRTADRIGPAITSTREVMAPRMEQAREVAGRAWETRIKRSAEATSKRAKSAEKLSRRARRNARQASTDAGRLGRQAAKQSRKGPARKSAPRRNRWMMAIGIGAAIGAIGAMISKRKSPEWEQYEPTEPASGTIGEPVTDMAEARRRTGTVVGEPGEPSGKHAAGGPPEREPGAPVTGPTTEPSSMRSPDTRPPGT